MGIHRDPAITCSWKSHQRRRFRLSRERTSSASPEMNTSSGPRPCVFLTHSRMRSTPSRVWTFSILKVFWSFWASAEAASSTTMWTTLSGSTNDAKRSLCLSASHISGLRTSFWCVSCASTMKI